MNQKNYLDHITCLMLNCGIRLRITTDGKVYLLLFVFMHIQKSIYWACQNLQKLEIQGVGLCLPSSLLLTDYSIDTA